jgi:hypothetical protein
MDCYTCTGPCVWTATHVSDMLLPGLLPLYGLLHMCLHRLVLLCGLLWNGMQDSVVSPPLPPPPLPPSPSSSGETMRRPETRGMFSPSDGDIWGSRSLYIYRYQTATTTPFTTTATPFDVNYENCISYTGEQVLLSEN